MKKRLAVLLAAIVAACVLASTASAASLIGHVYIVNTTTGIANVQVTIHNGCTGANGSTRTAFDGSFHFTSLVVGCPYSVMIYSTSGYCVTGENPQYFIQGSNTTYLTFHEYSCH